MEGVGLSLMTKSIEQLTAAKTDAVLQELRNLIINFDQNGLEIGQGMKDFLGYMRVKEELLLEDIRRQEKTLAKNKKNIKRCPKCRGIMRCHPVNTSPGDQIGGNWKSQWLCIICGHYILRKNDYKIESKINSGG